LDPEEATYKTGVVLADALELQQPALAFAVGRQATQVLTPDNHRLNRIEGGVLARVRVQWLIGEPGFLASWFAHGHPPNPEPDIAGCSGRRASF
jgi:hypothetical protein